MPSYLQSLCISLEEFRDKGAFEIRLICDAKPMELALDLVTSLEIIVTEVISNAYIHAFPAGLGTIRVTLDHRDGKVILTIADKGIGFVEKKASKRHGVGLIKRLMGQAKGTTQLADAYGLRKSIDERYHERQINVLLISPCYQIARVALLHRLLADMDPKRTTVNMYCLGTHTQKIICKLRSIARVAIRKLGELDKSELK